MDSKLDKNKIREEQNSDDRSILELSDRLCRQKQIDVDKNWRLLDSRIHHDTKKKTIFFWLRNAAAILLLPLIIISIYFYNQNLKLRNVPVTQMELMAAYGTRTRVVLSDGSEVWLNSGSKLIYPDRFTEAHREVTLSGEAFFKVQSDKDHRFDVKTSDGIVVSAYGTEFNVEAYEDEEEINATLVKGSIGMRNQNIDEIHYISPGEQIVYVKNTDKIFSQEVSLPVETGWKDGKLVFRRTPLPEVAKLLSRHFNVKIILQGKELLEYNYSATFTVETLDEILSLLEKTAPIKCSVVEPEQRNADLTFTEKKVLIREV